MEQVKLKGIMAENKILQKDLAKLIQVSEKTMNDKINGYKDFKLREAQTIACFFKRQIEEIFLQEKLISDEQNKRGA